MPSDPVPVFQKQVVTVVIPGGVPGDHKVPGQSLVYGKDALVSVRHIDTEALGTNADLTAQFSITGDNLINNVGGADTTGAWLVVTFMRK